MKKYLILLLLSSAQVFCSQKVIEKPYSHRFSSNIFYRTHTEKEYDYNTGGLGIQYKLYKEEGINAEIAILRNLTDEYSLNEIEVTLKFRHILNINHIFYPSLSLKGFSHKIDEEDGKKMYNLQAIGFLGYGWEWKISDMFLSQTDISFFKDSHNSVFCRTEKEYWGFIFRNPIGIRLKIGTKMHLQKNRFVKMNAYFSKTLKKCYREFGTELSFNWEF